jgi:hypothetical protein
VPSVRALFEATFFAGLRLAGMPEPGGPRVRILLPPPASLLRTAIEAKRSAMGIAGVVDRGCPFKLPFRDGDWLLR